MASLPSECEPVTRTSSVSRPGGPRRGRLAQSAFDQVTSAFLVMYTLFIAALIWATMDFSSVASFYDALTSREVLFAIRLSLITATFTALLSVAVGLPTAYALSRRQFRGKAFVDTLLDLPVVLPPVAAGVALLALYQSPLGTVAKRSGLDLVFTPEGIILAQFTVVSALGIRVLKASFDGLDPRYERVARTLGFSPWQTFVKIVLPLSSRAIVAAAVMTWARAMGEFGATIVFAGATSFRTEVLSIAIFLNLAVADLDAALAITLILMVISLATLLLFRRFGERSAVV